MIRKVKALKAKLKATPSNRRSTVHQSRVQEPIAVNLAPSNVVENLVESHFEQESSEARNVNILQDEFPEFLSRDSAIGNISNESLNNSISLPMDRIPVPFPIEANISDINSIDNMNPPRVEVHYEEDVLPRPEVFTPDADDFGNAEFEDIQSLGFDQNVMSSFRDDRPTKDQSAEKLHHISDIQPRSSMRENVPITQTLFGDSFQPNAEMSIAHQSMLNSTQLSPRNYAMFEKSGTALPDYNRTPVALAASSFIIAPFSGVEYGDSLSNSNDPQSEDTRSVSSVSSRRMLMFNNIHETFPDQAHRQHRRRRAQRVHDYVPDILNSSDDIMIMNSILVIPESIMKNPHNNPRMFK